MKRQELEDLIKVVKFFADTEVELQFKPKWTEMLEILYEVRKQEWQR